MPRDGREKKAGRTGWEDVANLLALSTEPAGTDKRPCPCCLRASLPYWQAGMEGVKWGISLPLTVPPGKSSLR